MKNNKLRNIACLCFLFSILATPFALNAQNAFQRAGHDIRYKGEVQVTASSGDDPLWLNANRYGLSSVDGSNGYLRGMIIRSTESDSAHHWRIGFGADAAVTYGFTSRLVLHQLYGEVAYRKVRLTIGAKEQPMMLKHASLSSGSQTLGINSRPAPAVRFELPDYWVISGKRHPWAAIRGHISYGLLTDGRFQEDYSKAGGGIYARHALLHTKAGYLKLGNEKKFPITFEGGLEWATIFGGTSYNAGTWDGNSSVPIKHPVGLGDIIDATFGTGGDETDGNGYANSIGNTLGSWVFRLNYKGKDWGIGIYYDHFFEDHSQMFFEYGWLDGLIGIEAQLPHNPIVDALVYEYIKTTYQSGPVYHDHTSTIPDQISGCDNYYNHNLYPGWQHWGQAIGNPLFTTPLYNHNGSLTFASNRFKAHHFAIQGQPTSEIGYRMLYTHERSVGTYASPFYVAKTMDSFMAEVIYSPLKLGRLNTDGWQLKAAFAIDRGDLIGKNTGFQFTLSKSGLLTH